MGQDVGDDRERPEVWICECQRGSDTFWRWLCRGCVFSERKATDERGQLVWQKIRPRTKLAPDYDCDRCWSIAHPDPPDPGAERRSKIASYYDKGRVRRWMEKGKIVEEVIE